jgi:hypothetical protein
MVKYANWNPDQALTAADTVTLTYATDFSLNGSAITSTLNGIDVAGMTFGAAALGNIGSAAAGEGFDLVGDITNNSADTATGISLGTNLLITTDSTLRTITNYGTQLAINSDIVVGSGGLQIINAASALQSGFAGISFTAASQITGSGAVSLISNDVDVGLNLASYTNLS